MNIHSLSIAILIGSAVATWSSQATANDMPYQAEVIAEKATTHCGPGASYYATDRLSEAARVEVYRHTKEGWCAIRPIENSFSLIPSTHVRLADGDSLAEVIEEKAVSWIGSAVAEPDQMLWQVRLDVGEVVEIVGIVRRDNLAGTEKILWYKIRPPAGEFRYVRLDQIKRINANSPAADLARRVVAEPAIRVASHNAEIAPRTEAEPPATKPDTGWRVTTNPRVHASADQPSQRVAMREPTIARQAQPTVSPGAAPTSAVNPSDLDIDATLSALQVDLVKLAAQPINEWDFSSIETRLAALDKAETTTRQRTQMVRYRDRLKKFVALKEQRDTIAQSTQSIAQDEEPIATEPTPSDTEPVATPLSDSVVSAADANPNLPIGTGVIDPVEPIGATEEPLPADYDGVGYLMPVISREQQAPPFALLDKKGNVLGFVSPQPGLNLRRYVKQEVGVIGQRGYLPRYQATHLTAQRIIVLDRHR